MLFAVEDVNWIGTLLDFRTNFLNWLLLVGILAWACAKFLPPFFETRRRLIDSQFKDAADAKELAAQLLAQSKHKTAQADNAAQEIIAEAKQAAEQLKAKLEAQAKQDLEDLKKNFEAACANERQLAISQMREIAVKTALQLVQANISNNLSESSKSQLLTQFIEQLDQLASNEASPPSKQFEKIH